MRELQALQARLDGDLLTPGSPAYDAARRPALARYQAVHPRALVRCASVSDVVRTLSFARQTGTQVVPRGGGHCFAGRSSTTGVVLDLSRLDGVVLVDGGRARIGAGARLQAVYDALHRDDRTIPAGCGPTVGIAGLTLGGGIGLLGRAHGLTCDALLGARVVLADGTVVDCDRDHEPDLFWALRGAGGGQFGVVTSLVFETLPEPRATRFALHWPERQAAEVVAAWQDWAPDAPDDLTANLTVAAEPARGLGVLLFGAALHDPGRTRALLDDLVQRVGSAPTQYRDDVMAWRDLKRSFAADEGVDDTAAAVDAVAPVTTASRSEFFDRPMPTATIAALLDGLATQDSATRAPGRALHFTAMGGAYNRVPEDGTAFAHRRERFLLEHVAEAGDPWVSRSWGIAHGFASGRVYPNFPDSDLDGWKRAYHGRNLERLETIKRRHDPDRLFRFPQAIGSESNEPVPAAEGT